MVIMRRSTSGGGGSRTRGGWASVSFTFTLGGGREVPDYIRNNKLLNCFPSGVLENKHH